MKRKQCSFDITFIIEGKEITPQIWSDYLKKYFVMFKEDEHFELSLSHMGENNRTKISAWGCLELQDTDESEINCRSLIEGMSKDGYRIIHQATFFARSDYDIDENKVRELKNKYTAMDPEAIAALLEENKKLKATLDSYKGYVSREHQMAHILKDIEEIINDDFAYNFLNASDKLDEIERLIIHYLYGKSNN